MSDIQILTLVTLALALGAAIGGVTVGGWRMAGAHRDREEVARLRGELARLLTAQGTPTVPWAMTPGRHAEIAEIVRQAADDAWAERLRGQH